MQRRILPFLLILFLFSSPTLARDRKFGLGFIFLEPTGLSGKFWIPRKAAVDGACGWSLTEKKYLHLHADYFFPDLSLFKGDKALISVYFGLGGRIEFRKNDKVGLRLPLGMDFISTKAPLDLFIEIVPIFNLAPSTGFDLKAALGIRYLF